MAGYNAMTETYEEITLLEKPALFTGARLDRSTVPEGLYAYDVRHDDESQGIPCEVAKYIMVNHWGTVLMAEPLELGEDGRIFLEEDDWNYASIPSQTRGLVGRISYLGLNGEVYQTTNYMDMESLKRDSLQSSDCGEPIQITLFERPEDTESILKKESDWVKELNPVTCRISYEFIKGDRADCRTVQEFLETYAPHHWRDRLCEKLYEEQQTYRNWLLEQTPEDILNYAYTYAMREDIVVAAEDYSLLTESQAKALCQSLSPMNEIYSTFDKRDASNMEVIADCISCRGRELEQKKKEERDKTVVAQKEALTEVLSSGETLGNYLVGRGRLTSHLTSGNAALVLKENPQATAVQTYEQWKSFGRNIYKGKTGTMILTQRDGYLVTDKVFDISQTVGNKEYPSHSVAGNTAKLKAAINALMEFAPVEVQYTSGEGLPAEYIPESELLECRKDVPPEDVFRYLPQAIILGCTHLHGEGGNEQELTKLYALAVSVELCGHFGITPVKGYKEMLNSFKDHVPQGEERAMLEEIREFSRTMGDTISKAVMQVREQRIAENRSR